MGYFSMVLTDPVYQEGIINALNLGLVSTLMAALIAVPLAVINNRYAFPGRKFLSLALLIPMILPPFIGAVGIKCILGTEGSLNGLLFNLGWMSPEHPRDWLAENRFLGIVLMNALHLYPILYLNAAASLAQVDPALEQAAANLGCSPSRRFFRITLPLILPGLFAGARSSRFRFPTRGPRANSRRHQEPRSESPALRSHRHRLSHRRACIFNIKTRPRQFEARGGSSTQLAFYT
ncbi:iron ABC transporter permease [bacterium]|nr:iron ABC transporter permease [bacterium]